MNCTDIHCYGDWNWRHTVRWTNIRPSILTFIRCEILYRRRIKRWDKLRSEVPQIRNFKYAFQVTLSLSVYLARYSLYYWWILGYWMTFEQLHMLFVRYYETMVTSCNLKGLQRKWSWPTLSYCGSTCHEELRTATNNRNRNCRCPRWDLNEMPPRYKFQVLLLGPTSFLQFHVCLSVSLAISV